MNLGLRSEIEKKPFEQIPKQKYMSELFIGENKNGW